MLAVVFVISCVSVCGFYIYVLVQLQREQKQESERRKHLPEHLLHIGSRPPKGTDSSVSWLTSKRRTDDSQSSRREAASHRETMLGIGFSIAGLLSLFAGIELLNSFAKWLH